jgi:hypothetical protein
MKLATLHGPLGIGGDYFRYVQAAKMDQATPPLLDRRTPHNIGDWFVTKIADRLLDFDELLLLTRAATDADWEVVNSECEALVLKGGNYIQDDWFSKTIGLPTFQKAEIPIVLLGAGLQAPIGGRVSFADEEVEILRLIHDSCASSSVRGESTAEALAAIGIDNVVVTGCPTIFWSRKPRLEVREPTDDSAAFSFRQALYSTDPGVHRAQFDAMNLIRERFGRVKVLMQGEEVLVQHFVQATTWGAEFKARVEQLPGLELMRIERVPLDPDELREEIHYVFDRYADPTTVDWMLDNAFFSYDIGQYLDEYRAAGMVIGCRLHSNLLALASETPTFYLTYDERTQELVELFDIPSCRLWEFGPHVDLLDQDWGPFEERYAHHYHEMRGFLEANGLRSRMAAPVPDG